MRVLDEVARGFTDVAFILISIVAAGFFAIKGWEVWKKVNR